MVCERSLWFNKRFLSLPKGTAQSQLSHSTALSRSLNYLKLLSKSLSVSVSRVVNKHPSFGL